MADDGIHSPNRYRDRRAVSSRPRGVPLDGRGCGPIDQDILTFVKALARDLARADAMDFGRDRVPAPTVEEMCGEPTTENLRTGL